MKTQELKNIIGELSKIFGSILFDSFVPYIVTSIHSQNSDLPIMYIIFGFVGVIMIFMAYISK